KTIMEKGVNSSAEPYKLQDNYGWNFRAIHENSSEDIFAVQFVGKDGSGTYYNARRGDRLNYPFGGGSGFNCCGFYQPTTDLVNTFRTNSKGLPYIKSYNQHPIKSDMGIASKEHFTPDQGNIDPRLDYTVGRRGVPYKDWGPMRGKAWV